MQADTNTHESSETAITSSKFYSVFYSEEQLYRVQEPENFIRKLEKESEASPSAPIVQGNRSSPTCILFRNENAAALPEADAQFLNNILKAVNLSLNQVAWINLAIQPQLDPQTLEQKILLIFESESKW